MTWIMRNWYFILIAGAIIIWIVIDPSYNQQEQTIVEMNEELTENADVKEEPEIQTNDYMVDIKGAITNPGVYQVTEENRIQDVIKMAGGFEEEANIEAINLAERVYDEMVIIVPFIGEENVMPITESSNGKIKINQATTEEITSIPGIGEVKANAIMEYRDTNGKFKEIEDLTKVSGIGEKTLELMREHVQIP